MKKGFGFLVLISIAIILVIMFLLGQTLSLFNYKLTVAWGLQESSEEVGDVGVAFLKGYAFGDTIFYIPLLVLGIIGLIKRRKWGLYSMFGALAISVYWPATILYAVFIERTAITLTPDKYISFSILLPLIMIYGLLGCFIYTGIKKNIIKGE